MPMTLPGPREVQPLPRWVHDIVGVRGGAWACTSVGCSFESTSLDEAMGHVIRYQWKVWYDDGQVRERDAIEEAA